MNHLLFLFLNIVYNERLILNPGPNTLKLIEKLAKSLMIVGISM